MTTAEIGCWYSWAVRQDFDCAIIGGDDYFSFVQLPGGRAVLFSDANRHDAHCHLGFHGLRMQLHIQAGLKRGKSKDALASQTFPHGTSRHKHVFSIDGTVQSGVPDTSLANTRQVGLQFKYALSVVPRPAIGDPLPPYLARVLRVVEDVGFPQTGDMSYDLAAGDFFSAYFVPVSEDRFVLTPKFTKIVAKLFYCRKQYNELGYLCWLKGVCVGFMPVIQHLPIISAIFRRTMLLMPVDIIAKKYYLEELYQTKESFPPNKFSTEWFCRKYNTTPDFIAAEENRIMSVPTLPYNLSGHFYEMAYEIDSGEALPLPDETACCFNMFDLYDIGSLILAPLMEEFVKHGPYGMYFAYGIGLFEAMPYMLDFRKNLFAPVARIFTHVLMASLPLYLAVPMHAALNYAVSRFLFRLVLPRLSGQDDPNSWAYGGWEAILSFTRFRPLTLWARYLRCIDPDALEHYGHGFGQPGNALRVMWRVLSTRRNGLPPGVVQVLLIKHKITRVLRSVVVTAHSMWNSFPGGIATALRLFSNREMLALSLVPQ
jgi:hypothetical protein